MSKNPHQGSVAQDLRIRKLCDERRQAIEEATAPNGARGGAKVIRDDPPRGQFSRTAMGEKQKVAASPGRGAGLLSLLQMLGFGGGVARVGEFGGV